MKVGPHQQALSEQLDFFRDSQRIASPEIARPISSYRLNES
jgi:hypothetical protein